jgi:hypothetical protein
MVSWEYLLGRPDCFMNVAARARLYRRRGHVAVRCPALGGGGGVVVGECLEGQQRLPSGCRNALF